MRIYEVSEKSLTHYRGKNKYGFNEFPKDDFRLFGKEIKGKDDLLPEELEKFGFLVVESNRF